MATQTQTLAIARAHLGNVGGGIFKAAFGASSTAAWCAYFVSWVLREAGVPGPRTGWTPAIVSWAKANGRWKTSGPRAGDLVLFMWAGVSASGRGAPPVCHVGFVEAVNRDGSITTIEGNTSGTAAGSQYNGNLCARRIRSSNIVGYVALAYDGTTVATAPPADTRPRNADGSLTIAADGVRGGATNARWQEVMGTPIDGTISTPSALIDADQHFLNAAVDHGHIRTLTGRDTLKPDGYEGKLTIVVRQFWLFNTIGPRILGRGPLLSDFDAVAGARTNTLHQHALNAATARSGRY